ncbi:LacI family DNA-binding transcriptional regulator [Frondihabitans cladoniiphilus]|uniref:LacI family DNA-binding transcriptional regulator n=1 Tax=Frondihabitans cladoniiphilus TaxID=715785 RepID=A0ABP8VT22_9MICO
MTDRAPTIRDVAARAGVSKSLVSLVLQGGRNVGTQRREAVEAAIAELGYRPNLNAQNLSQTHTRTIGVLLNDLRNPWYVDLVEEAVGVLHEHGLSPLLADSHLTRKSGRDPAEIFLGQRIEGMLVIGTAADEDVVRRIAAEVPTVLAGTTEPHLPHVDSVSNDDELGERLATEHLLSLGHRDIALLLGPGAVGRSRRAGYEAAMASAGLTSLVRTAAYDMTEQGGSVAAASLFASGPRPTAIVAFNDVGAVGALTAVEEAGLSVPEDVSLIGYDDTSLARLRHLSLTSVDNRNAEVGRIAAEELVTRMLEPDLPARSNSVVPILRVRATTAAPRG